MKNRVIACVGMLMALLVVAACGLAEPVGGADGGYAETVDEAWKKLPDGVRAALGDELSAWRPIQWEHDLLFTDRLSVLLREGERVMLCFLKQDGGAWSLMMKSDRLVSADDLRGDVQAGFTADGLASVYLYAEDPYLSQEFLFEEDSDGFFSLIFFRDISGPADAPLYTLDAREGGYLINRRPPNALQATVVYSDPGLRFDEVSGDNMPALVGALVDARNDMPETPPAVLKDSIPEPRNIADFSAGQGLTVYTAPGGEARAADGAPLTDGWLQLFGEEDGWALVQHNVGDGVNRIGYVPVDAVSPVAMPALLWEDEARVTSIGLTLTDDPLRSGQAVLALPPGETVRRLASFGAYWAYVETTDDAGQRVRGFVIDAFLMPEAEAQDEIDELGALVNYWLAMYGNTRYLDVGCKERLRAAYSNAWPAYDTEVYNERLPLMLRRGVEIMLEDGSGGEITFETLARYYVADMQLDPSYEKTAYQLWITPYDMNAEREFMPYWIAIDAETGDMVDIAPGGNG